MRDRPRRWYTGWAVWNQTKPVRVYVSVVVVVALLATAFVATTVPVRQVDFVRCAILAAAAAIHIELTRQVERQREYLRIDGAPYIDLKSVWSFAALIVLPPALASAIAVWTYAVAWWRIWPGVRPVPLYRWTFSAATVLIATQVVVAVLAVGMHHYPGAPDSTVLGGLLDLGVLAAAGVVRWFINTALVYVALMLSNPDVSVKTLFSNVGEYVLEAGALALGALSAALVVGFPVMLAAIVVVLVALHRGLLVHQFQTQARLDAKTSLASARWWTQTTGKLLTSAKTRAGGLGVLMIDIDLFKTINDQHGHPVGDRVLGAVADAIRAELRHEDLAGRFGGEEFVVALPNVGTEANLRAVAERVRRRIATLAVEDYLPDGDAATVGGGVTVSIGGARYPGRGLDTVDDLVRAADTALYRAKEAGRDQVRLAENDPATS